MIDLANDVLPFLCRTSLMMLLTMVIIRLVQPQSPRWCRTLSVLVIVQGWLFVPWTLEIPWYEASLTQRVVVPNATQELQTISRQQNDTTYFSMDLNAKSSWSQPGQIIETAREATTAAKIKVALMFVWLGGILIIAVAVAMQYCRLRRELLAQCEGHAQSDEDIAFDRDWQDLQKRRGVTSRIPLRMTVNAGPMLCRLQGVWCLLVPHEFWNQSSVGERQTIMRHELSHYLRRDVQKSWCLGLMALPYWFHPAAWWALRTFRESSEYLCDEDAVHSLASKRDYLNALERLAESHQTVPAFVGHCVHTHPLLLRMRRLLEGSSNEDSAMKKFGLAIFALLLVLVQTVRVELVAQSPDNVPQSIVAVKDRMTEYEKEIESLKDLEASIKSHIENLKQTVDTKVEELNALRENPEQLSEEGRRRGKLFLNGGEAEQMESIKDIAQHVPRDEAVLLCGLVAKKSEFTAVRRDAIKAAASLKQDGYPAFAIAYESLGTEDRIFLIEQTREFDPADRAAFFAMIAKDADEALLNKLISEPFADDRRLVLLGAIAKVGGDAVIAKIIQEGTKLEGPQGMLILFGAASAKNPEHVLAAINAVRTRGKDAFPVLGAAVKCSDPKVRGELVRVAKEIGGEEGEFIVQQALADKSPELKEAAEKALAQ